MTLQDGELLEMLAEEFVVGWRNIDRSEHVGLSHGYRRDQTAVGTTNGAGGRNVQLLVLAPDRTVLHALPGFWHPEDLAAELRFAKGLYRLWLDDAYDRPAKDALFAAMHRAFMARLSPATVARSEWQPFDAAEELQRVGKEKRDTVVLAGNGGVKRLKAVCTLVHERMLARPFLRLEAFDMDAFVDYGRAYYDNNLGMDKGKRFSRAERNERQRQQKEAREQRKQAKAAARGA